MPRSVSTTVGGLDASATRSHSTRNHCPDGVGRLPLWCVRDGSYADESDSMNNCSAAIGVSVIGNPTADLVVSSFSASDDPVEGESFTLNAVVENDGDASSAATTLRYYRSEDSGIATDDTEVGESTVPSMPAGSSSELSFDLVAPSAGTYYYGACVDSVANESATTNNCSTSARVTVAAPEASVAVGTIP